MPEFTAARLRSILAGLPRAAGYRVELKPLRYQKKPHLQASCDYDARLITLQVPEPFRPFRERVDYRAKRIKTAKRRRKPFTFRWFHRDVHFRTRTDVVRFLYCHEFHHYYQYEILGRKGSAETACDRFALENFRKRPGTRVSVHGR